MAIIYSYPDNANILLTDLLIGTSTVRIAGKKKNLTKNFTVEALGNFISLNNPTVWGNIVGNLQDQTDLWSALESKQGNITLTTNGVDGPSTFIADVLNIPDYSAGVPIPTLDQVLLAGNISLLDAKIGKLFLHDDANGGYGKIQLNDNIFAISKSDATGLLYIDDGFTFQFRNSNNGVVSLFNPLTVTRNYTFPDKDGIFAMLSDITGGTLQQVTDAGNTTTNSIILDNTEPYGDYSSINTLGSLYSNYTLNSPTTGLSFNANYGSEGIFLTSIENITTNSIDINDSEMRISYYDGTNYGAIDLNAGVADNLGGSISLSSSEGIGTIRVSALTNNIQLEFPNKPVGLYTIATTDDIPSITPAGLTKTDDTNVTLTLGGTPNTSLLQAVSLTLGWTGTLADSRIASASNWNTAYTNRITSLTTTGSGAATLIANVLNIPTPTTTGFVPYTGATQSVDLGVFNLTANSIIKQGGTSTQFLMADGTVTIGNGGVYSYEIHVSQVDGNDTTGTGALLNPVASITKALTLVSGLRKTIVIHPGNYTENPNITVQYTVLTTYAQLGGNTALTGTITTNTGCTISGLKMSNLTVNGVTGRGNINILNCDITGTFTKNGTADYTLVRFCDIGALNIVSTAGVLAIFGGNPSFITVNSAGASVLVKNAVCISPVVLVGGATFADCILISTGSTTNALTSSAGTQIVIANSQCVIPTFQGVSRVSLSGFYSILNCVFDKPNSTLVALSGTGGSTNSIVYSQFINADKFIKQGGTSLQYLMADGSVSTGNAGTVTSVAALTLGNTGTDLTSTVADGTTTPVITLNVPTASATNRGALSTTDWSTFNNKANANTELNIRRTGYTVYNEFLSSVSNGSYNSATVLAGTITSPTGIVDANHFGVVAFNSVAAANSGYYSALNPSAAAHFSCTLVAGLQSDLVFKTPGAISPTTTIRFGVGSGTISSTEYTSGFYFEIISNQLVGKTANSATRSSTAAYTISADTWYHLRVKVTSVTLITYSVYDMNGALLFSATLSTNLPTTTLVMNQSVIATNSAGLSLILGYFDLISITFPSMVRGALN